MAVMTQQTAPNNTGQGPKAEPKGNSKDQRPAAREMEKGYSVFKRLASTETRISEFEDISRDHRIFKGKRKQQQTKTECLHSVEKVAKHAIYIDQQ